MSKKYSNQIAKVDGAGKFIEVLNNPFPIGKVQFNLSEYDKITNKRKSILPFYIDAQKTLVLADDLISGRFKSMVDAAIATNNFEGQTVSSYTSYFTDRGGIPEDKVRNNFAAMQKIYPFLKEGMAVARLFKIQKATNAGLDWIVRVEYGPGKSNEKGLIVPTEKAPLYVNVAMSNAAMMEMMMAIKVHYSAYLNQYYTKFGDKMFPRDSCEIFSPESTNS